MAFSASLKTIGTAVAVALAGATISEHGLRMASNQAHAQRSQPATAAPSTVAAAGVITLRSVSVDLPSSDRMFPGGADAAAINNNCLTCHSAGMILNQPSLSRTVWQQEVEKMRAQYKAPVAEADVPAIVAYLVEHKGMK